MSDMTFLAELQRRRVPRVIAVYIAAVFAGAQGTDLLISALHLPPWVLTVFVISGLAGLPVVAVVAWVFDFTPRGLVRTPDVDADRPFVWRPAHFGVALVAIVVLLGAGWAVLRPQPHDPGRVAVLPLENRTGEATYAALGQIAADWIIEGLVRTGFVAVVDIQTALAAAAGANGTVSAPTGAGTLVSGAYYLHEGELLFQIRLSRADGTLLEALPPIRAAAADATAAVDDVRGRVLSALAAHYDPRLARFEGDGSAAPAYAAYEAYVEGLQAYLHWDLERAARRFRHAVEADTTFLRAVLWSAVADGFAGYQQRADSGWARLRAQEAQLSPYDRHNARFFQAFFRGDLEAAYQEAKRMHASAPGSAQAVRELAISALRTWRLEEALRLFDALDPDRSMIREWPEYWYFKALTLELMGRPQEALAVAREGRRRHPEVMMAHAEAMILVTLGQTGDAAAIARTDGVPRDAHDLRFLAPLAVRIAAAGSEEEAHRLLDEGTAVARRLESSYHAAAFLYLAGRYTEAQAELQSAAPEPGRDRASEMAGLAGAVAARLGDVVTARAWLAALDQIGATRTGPVERARIHAIIGEPDEVVRLLGRRTLPMGTIGNVPLPLDPAFASLRGDPAFENLMRPVR